MEPVHSVMSAHSGLVLCCIQGGICLPRCRTVVREDHQHRARTEKAPSTKAALTWETASHLTRKNQGPELCYLQIMWMVLSFPIWTFYCLWNVGGTSSCRPRLSLWKRWMTYLVQGVKADVPGISQPGRCLAESWHQAAFHRVVLGFVSPDCLV